MRKIRIVFVINSMVANGAERVMSLLLNKAIAEGDSVKLILVSSGIIEYPIDPKVEICVLREKAINDKWNTFTRIKLLRQEIINFNANRVVSFLTTCNIYASIATLGTQIKLIVSERNDPKIDCPSRFRRIVRKIAYGFVDSFIFQTEDARNYFGKKISKRSIVVPNPVKSNLPIANRNEISKTIVAVGRLTAQKNYPMMIKAFALFCEKHSDYTLKIYGEGELYSELYSLTESFNLTKKVIFCGYESDWHSQVKDSAMYILSSNYEGMSNSLLEALAMGIPSISTDCPCGGSRYMISNMNNGILVDVDDEKALMEAMLSIADNKVFADRLSEEALRIRETQSEDVILDKYYSFIRSV